MANVLIKKSTMTNIANAIRNQTGKEDLIFPKDMANEIRTMDTSSNLRLTNGLIDKTIGDIYIDTPVGDYAFYQCKTVNPTFGIKCARVGSYAFYQCEAITEINLNTVYSVSSYSFAYSKLLTKVDAPNLLSISGYAFFYTNLTTLILRSNMVCSISTTTPLHNTPIATGTGYIYVPKKLVERYKTTSGWITFANQIRAIEDYPEITRTNQLINNITLDNSDDDVFINEQVMKDIGNAIRYKTGKNELILPKNMPTALLHMSEDGDSSLVSSIIDRSVEDIYINRNVLSYTFNNCKSIKPTFGDNCKSIGNSAFEYCDSLVELNTNKVTSLSSYAFSGAKNLQRVDLPNVTSINSYVFSSSVMETLILRSKTACSGGSYMISSSSPIAKGTGYIYVPKDLVETYKTKTYWKDYASQIRAIEDYPEITGGL